MTTVPGSEIITSGLNMISQSLQIPVIIFLVIFAIFAVITLGGLISEYTSRRKISVDSLEIIACIDSEYGVAMTGVAKENFYNITSLTKYVVENM